MESALAGPGVDDDPAGRLRPRLIVPARPAEAEVRVVGEQAALRRVPGGSRAAGLLDRLEALRLEDEDASRLERGAGGETAPLVLAEVRGERVALQVERLAGQQEIYVKTVPGVLTCARALAGLTVLGDGNPIFLLDLNQLI